MKAIKWMLFGIALMLFGGCCLLAEFAGGGIGLAPLGLLSPGLGLIICILALSMKE